MAGVFITSIGTDTGKTLVACALLHQMFKAGKRVRAIKPIASGFADNRESDPVRLLRAMGMPQHLSAIQQICPWLYEEAISPHIAARRVGRPIIWRELLDFCLQHINASGVTIVEGAGGVMSPVDQQRGMLDLMIALDVPVVLVVSNYLGAISHSLTALKVMQAEQIRLAGIVISAAANGAVEKDEMNRLLRQATDAHTPICWIDRLSDDTDNYKHAPSLEALWSQFPNS